VVLLEEEGGLGLRLGDELVVPVLAHVAASVAHAQIKHPNHHPGQLVEISVADP
jgi:hypothetical protein